MDMEITYINNYDFSSVEYQTSTSQAVVESQSSNYSESQIFY